jgi:mannose-1-phosphate guanylyltransferase
MEKPSWDQVTTNMINAGIYLLNKEVLQRIPPQTNYSFERQLFPQLLEKGESIYGYPSQAYWTDIGTSQKYLSLHYDLMRGEVKGYSLVQGKMVKIGQGCNIHPETQIIGPVIIGNNCTISRGAKLIGPVVIGAGNTIGEEVIINSSITWHNVRFGQRANIHECIIANDCFLAASVHAEKAVIGDRVTISRNTRLAPGSRIWPLTQ